MKLLYVTEALPHGSGESFLIPEIREILRQGHALTIIPVHTRQRVREELKDLAPFVRSVPYASLTALAAMFLRAVESPLKFIQLNRVLLRSGSLRNYFLNLRCFPKACLIANAAKRDHIQHIHAHWATTPATVAWMVSKLTGIPFSISAHRYDIVANNLFRQKATAASFVRFISKSGIDLAQQVLNGPVPGSHFIIHVGIELPPDEAVDASIAARGRNRPLHIVCAANFVPVKGHEFLLEAAQILANRGAHFKLSLIGDGPLREALQTKYASCRQASFLGHMPHHRLLKLYEAGEVDIVVLPSVDLGNGLHEGIPVSLIEAMGWAIPTITTRTGGIPELAGDNGIMVAPGSPQELVAAVEALQDVDARLNLSWAGRRAVEQAFDVKGTSSSLIELIRKAES